MLKPGIKTTEFAVTVLTSLGALVAALAGDLAPHWAAIAAIVSSSAYALARGLAKMTPPVVAVTHTAPTQAVTPPTPPVQA